MVRGRSFYAVWDEERGLWSTDEYDVQRLVDADLHRYAREAESEGKFYEVMNLKSFNTNVWATFRRFMMNISDNSHTLDENLTFANTEVTKNDYVSRRLPYSLEPGTTDAWDELLGVLYSSTERDKIEWAIGAVVAGDAKRIQKFLVFYGPAGSGKSTVLNIIHRLFDGYVTTFDAKALGSNNGAFSTEVFKNNPLVAIQHDGDLSKIEDNTKLNSIISHEEMTMNEKFKPSYSARVNAFLFMGTNQPVKISDAKSGIIRRLIDVHPTGKTIESERYHTLMQQIEFEYGAVAAKCLERYRAMGKNYYSSYRPTEMMLQTDVFYNFVEAYYDIFKKQDGISLKQAYELYKEYCSYTGIEKPIAQYKFREELRNYFHTFEAKAEIEGVFMSSYYLGFKDIMALEKPVKNEYVIELEAGFISVFDTMYPMMPAQYAKASGLPGKEWKDVTTTLKDIDTFKLHWVKVPENHIVIDFDLVDEDGEKDLALNLEEAAKFPPTYTETSQSGKGIHLHYIYHGDVSELDNVYRPGVEIKTLLGNQSLRRRFDLCNYLEIASISSGLPKKEKKPVLEEKTIKSEKGLRTLIERNLRKEINPGTKSSVDFIHHILEEAYESDLRYDVRDMRSDILAFAARSTNHASECIKLVQKMHFASELPMEERADLDGKPIVFLDVEVYPNLFVVCWKFAGDTEVVRMINPGPRDIEQLLAEKFVGFNNRRYDNHILYAAYLGWSLKELFYLSQKLIDGKDGALFGEAYNLSYTDVYDFSSKKQGLKKFQIELGIHHQEMDLPWDQDVPEDRIQDVVDYCVNDVISLEVVFEARKQDFVARSILAELSGLSVNHTTQNHTARIIFGEDKRPQDSFVYTDLSEQFKGYKYDPVTKESTYHGETTGEGGYVYAEPGIYETVSVLDVASMHPTSIEQLNLFGPYTARFSELKEARMAIKHKDYETAGNLLGGRLAKFLGDAEGDPSSAEALSYALKIVINIVYGLTSARFPNPFKDPRNIDNIVAKRGALFMIDLKEALNKKGVEVVHIKTDSVKIPGCTPQTLQFVCDFGRRYGYDFELEATYERFCLVNDAVYIARSGDRWTAVGAQFQHPYVFKALFSNEEIEFDDLCETKSVTQGSMYLDFEMENHEPTTESMVHVGRTGSFVPVRSGGGTLWRVKDSKFYAVTGTKGYLWVTRDVADQRRGPEQDITLVDVDLDYFERLKEAAEQAIEYYGPFNKFVER
jgi:energy-coupling factor transporter ATP-binding protein EcfA2